MGQEEQIEDPQVEEQNPLDMSDEEIMNAAPPEEIVVIDEGTGEQEVDVSGVQEQEGQGQAAPEAQVDTDVFEEEDTPTPKNKKQAAKTDDEPAQEEAGPAGEINYQAEYERLLAPFKANGRQMQVHSVDDAMQLMQMGANYNKKMAGLKPNLKLMKMLEKNDLLDEEKLSFLIDLQTKDPAAIARFIKDSEVDPLDIDMDKGKDYKPKAYTVDDKEVELDGVLEEIQDTPTFQETIDIISNKWDAGSKQVLLDNPGLIKVINEHVDTGIYTSIHEIVENERAVGRLQGMNDIQAYKHVGDVIQANGGFNQQPPQQGAPDPQPQATEAAKPPADPSKLNERRRAAGSTNSAPAAAKQDFNPLALSDEEFEKISAGMM